MKTFLRGELVQVATGGAMILAVFNEQVSPDRAILRRYIAGAVIDSITVWYDHAVKADLYDNTFFQTLTPEIIAQIKKDLGL